MLVATVLSSDFKALNLINSRGCSLGYFAEKNKILFSIYEEQSKAKNGYAQNFMATLLQLETQQEDLKCLLLLIVW